MTNQDELATVVPVLGGAMFAVITQPQAAVYAGLNQLTIVLAAASSLAILLVLMLSYWMSRGIGSNVRTMARAAEGSASGDLNQSIDVHLKDEIGRTADSFRQMVR